jgi:hypothetical protein
MHEPAKAPLRRRIQTRAFRVINVPMRAALELPFSTPLSSNLMLAFVIGRKSGKTYRQPISYVHDGETLLTPGGGNWKRNLVEGTPVRLRIRGVDVLATPELVSDVDDVEKLLGVIVAGNPRAAPFIGIRRGADGRFDPAALAEAVSYGFRIVRWHPAATEHDPHS